MKKARKVFVSVLLVMLSFGSVVHASEQENVRLSDNERVKTNMLFRSISQTLNIGYEYNLGNESQRDLYHEQMVSIVEGLKADEWYSLELATWVNPSSVYDILITNDGEQVVIKINRDCSDSAKNCSVVVYPKVVEKGDYVSATLKALQELSEME